MNKQPIFGQHISVDTPPCLSDDLTSMVRKVVVQMSDDIENLIVDEIIKTAQQEGITDIYVLSKPNIISAIRKQIAVKPDIEGDGYDDKGDLIYETGYCPTCRHVVEIDYDTSEHCPKCGQALDWSDVQ